MSAKQSPRYIIISPVRDEEANLTFTLESVINQTIKPVAWIIVNDGSTDATGRIADAYAARFPWIRIMHRRNRGYRKSGSGVIETFYEAFRTVSEDWDYIVKLDGDMSFDADYFERCFREFDLDPRLGIAGGWLYHVLNGKKMIEEGPSFHVRGATKIYRRSCWEGMGGLWHGVGWDAIDDVNANFHGWSTRSIEGVEARHHRPTGAADGVWVDRVKHGLVCYTCGYHPLFLLASCFRRAAEKPYLSGALAMFWGYCKGWLIRAPRMLDRGYRSYVQRQQLKRLFGRHTIWH